MTPTVSFRAFIYKQTVFESAIEALRGSPGQRITEMFIPDLQIAINSKGYLFTSDKPRNEETEFLTGAKTVNPLTEIELASEVFERIRKVAALKLQLKALETELYADLSSHLKTS
jgi:hypothetical protein